MKNITTTLRYRMAFFLYSNYINSKSYIDYSTYDNLKNKIDKIFTADKNEGNEIWRRIQNDIRVYQ